MAFDVKKELKRNVIYDQTVKENFLYPYLFEVGFYKSLF